MGAGVVFINFALGVSSLRLKVFLMCQDDAFDAFLYLKSSSLRSPPVRQRESETDSTKMMAIAAGIHLPFIASVPVLPLRHHVEPYSVAQHEGG